MTLGDGVGLCQGKGRMLPQDEKAAERHKITTPLALLEGAFSFCRAGVSVGRE